MKERLLAIVPDPFKHRDFKQAGGALAAARATFCKQFLDEFEVEFVDTTMRPYPTPKLHEKIAAAAHRRAETIRLVAAFKPQLALAFCSARYSFYEKSLLLKIAKKGGARTYISLRSGIDPRDRWMLRYADKFINGFLVQSVHWTNQAADLGVSPGKTEIWYNPIDTSFWRPGAEGRRLCSPDRPFRFLFMGWATYYKGLRELIAAAEQLNQRPGPAFELVVAGGGSVGDELRERQNRGELPGNIQILGWVTGSNHVNQFERADALVLPTYHEGFPNAIAEAMSCALPVISTHIEAIPEIVIHEQTGLLIRKKHVPSLVDAMDKLRRDPQRAFEMGQAGLERVRAKFDQSVSVGTLIRILKGNFGSK